MLRIKNFLFQHNTIIIIKIKKINLKIFEMEFENNIYDNSSKFFKFKLCLGFTLSIDSTQMYFYKNKK